MIVGVPKEIKSNENRIAVVPAGAEALVSRGHQVLVEKGGGLGSGFADSAYETVGAEIVADVDELWQRAEMIVKVKEPIEPEYPRIRKGQTLFTYFHFAASRELTDAMLASGAWSRTVATWAPSSSRTLCSRSFSPPVLRHVRKDAISS